MEQQLLFISKNQEVGSEERAIHGIIRYNE